MDCSLPLRSEEGLKGGVYRLSIVALSHKQQDTPVATSHAGTARRLLVPSAFKSFFSVLVGSVDGTTRYDESRTLISQRQFINTADDPQ
jgi:hypothetical protein